MGGELSDQQVKGQLSLSTRTPSQSKITAWVSCAPLQQGDEGFRHSGADPAGQSILRRGRGIVFPDHSRCRRKPARRRCRRQRALPQTLAIGGSRNTRSCAAVPGRHRTRLRGIARIRLQSASARIRESLRRITPLRPPRFQQNRHGPRRATGLPAPRHRCRQTDPARGTLSGRSRDGR